MITRFSGTLEAVDGGRATLASGPMALEVLLTSNDAVRLAASVGRPITLYTMVLLESQSQGSSFTPRLLGFSSPRDRAFFELFTTVKGIGPRKALRALARPVGEVAAAIVAEDLAALTALPEVGRRTAQTIVAELGGKVESFADAVHAGGVPAPRMPIAAAADPAAGLPAAARDALAILQQLGEPPALARSLVETVLQGGGPVPEDPGAFVAAAYRGRDAVAP